MIAGIVVAVLGIVVFLAAIWFMLNMDDGYDDDAEHNDGEEW